MYYFRQMWLAAVHRGTDFNPDHNGVCERHFKPEDFKTDPVKKTKKERIRKSLKPGVVPSIFSDYPAFAQPRIDLPRMTSRATPSARREAQAQAAEQQEEVFFESQKIKDLEELLEKISKERLPSGYK